MNSYEKKGYLSTHFKLFHIADRQDKKFQFHYHDFYKIVFFLKGNVTYCVEGKTYDLSPYDIVLVGKDEIHRPIVDPDTEYERIVLYLSQSFLNMSLFLSDSFKVAKEQHVSVMRLSAGDFTKVYGLLKEAEEILKAGEYACDGFAGLKISETLMILGRSARLNGPGYLGNVRFNRKIIEVCEYINSHLSEDLTVDMLSSRFYESKYNFMRRFKECTGYSIHKYILEKRLLYTEKLVSEGDKVTFACIKAGFSNYSTYLRAKKRAESVKEKNQTDI